MTGSLPASPDRRAGWICLLLALVTLAVYWPVTRYEFVSYDDTDFIMGNPVIQAGLTAQSLPYAWHAEVARNWHPLTVLSHMLDCQLYGADKPGRHHLTNLLFHTANTLLLFLLLRRVTGAVWRSAFVAALFAWHPLHVESVAWVAERKDVLSTFFWWLTLWVWIAYADAAKSPGLKSKLFYAGAVFLFVLAAMSKPMVVTLPFVLLLLDFWPLRRFAFVSTGPPAPVVRSKTKPRPPPPLTKPTGRGVVFLVLEKIPFFIISVLLCIKTFDVQKTGGAVLDTLNLSMASRLGNALVSYVRYPARMFWPENLAALYLRHGDWPMMAVAGCGLLLIVFTVLVVSQVRARPYLAFGWFWYLGTLVPVIGLIQVGMQTMADRYTYLPLTGVFIILAWGGAELVARFSLPKAVPSVAAGLTLTAFVLLTSRQITWWQNSETLFKRMIDATDRNYMAHFNLGNVYSRENQTALALQNYREAISEEPNYADAHNNLAGLLLRQGQYDEAIQHYQDSARIKSTATAYFNLANAFADTARARHDTNFFAQSVQAFRQSLQLDPNSYATHNNFGMVWQDQNQDNLAVAEFAASIQNDPDFELGHFNLANALVRVGRLDEAITHYLTAARLKPDRIESFNGAAVCYARRGKMAEAAAQFRRVLDLNPRDSGTWDNLGNTLGSQNKFEEAIGCYQKALQIDPRDYQAEFNIGVSYLRQNRRDEAKTHFQAALRIQPDYRPAQQALAEIVK